MSYELVISVIALVVSAITGSYAMHTNRILAGLEKMTDCQTRFNKCDELFRKLNLDENNVPDHGLSEEEIRNIKDEILNNMEYYAFLVNNRYLGRKERRFHLDYFIASYKRLKDDIESQHEDNEDTFAEIIKLYRCSTK